MPRSRCSDSPRRARKCRSSRSLRSLASGDTPSNSGKSSKTKLECPSGTCNQPRRPSKPSKPSKSYQALCLRTRVEYPLQGLWLITEIFGNALHAVFGALLFYIGTTCARNIKYIEHLLVTIVSLATNDEGTKTAVLQFAWAFTYIFVFYGLFLINAFVLFATRLITARPSEQEEIIAPSSDNEE